MAASHPSPIQLFPKECKWHTFQALDKLDLSRQTNNELLSELHSKATCSQIHRIRTQTSQKCGQVHALLSPQRPFGQFSFFKQNVWHSIKLGSKCSEEVLYFELTSNSNFVFCTCTTNNYPVASSVTSPVRNTCFVCAKILKKSPYFTSDKCEILPLFCGLKIRKCVENGPKIATKSQTKRMKENKTTLASSTNVALNQEIELLLNFIFFFLNSGKNELQVFFLGQKMFRGKF